MRDDLTKVGSGKLIQVTTKGRRTGSLHSVELWFAVGEGKVYLSHEGKETDWMKNIKRNGEISFEIGGKTFTGTGRYLEDNTGEAWSAKVALYEKYYGKAAKDVIEDWFSLSRLLAIDVS